MEMMGYFLDNLRQRDPELAKHLSPHIEQYLSERAHIYTNHLIPENFTAPGGRIPMPTPQQEEEDKKEKFTDRQELFYSDSEIVELYKEYNISIPPRYAPQARPSSDEPHS